MPQLPYDTAYLGKLAATHAEERRRQRAPRADLRQVEDDLRHLELNPLHTYYAPVQGGYAVVAPVGKPGKVKHVVKTVLSSGMTPPGRRLPARRAHWRKLPDPTGVGHDQQEREVKGKTWVDAVGTGGGSAAPAPGLPDRDVTTPLPAFSTPREWVLSVQRHEADRAGTHLDLRLGDPATHILHSFAIPGELPSPGDRPVLAVPQPDHSWDYRDYSGVIPTGYGKGKVQLELLDRVEVVEAGPGKVKFNRYLGAGPLEYVLFKTNFGWLLSNITKRRDSVDVPSSKPKYREVTPASLDFDRPGQAWSPKLSGAHVTVLLERGKYPRIFSYRPTERSTGLIEHTHKLPGVFDRKVPPELDGVVVRGELYATNKEGTAPLEENVVGGMLNASVWKSRELQAQHGPLRLAVFDVVRGRDAKTRRRVDLSAVPYQEKLDVLGQVHKALPCVELPEVARTPQEKRQLLQRVLEGKHPQTREGIVAWDLVRPGKAPVKAKRKHELDVPVVGIFPGAGRHAGRAGGLLVEHAGVRSRVGTGLSDRLRAALARQPGVEDGLVAKVVANRVTSGGKLYQPAFKGFHLDKSDPARLRTLAELLEKTSAFHKLARAGHWRNISPGDTGHDEAGNPVTGKTWVKETLKSSVELRPYQQVVVGGFQHAPEQGQVLALGTGTGKTPVSLAIAESLRSAKKADRFLVVTPASLRTNYIERGVKKFTTSSVEQPNKPSAVRDATYVVVSLENFRERPDEWVAAVKPSGIIVDEVHKAKDPESKTFAALIRARKQVPYFLGLTGSLVSNRPEEVEPLVDLASGKERSFGGPASFKRRYTRPLQTVPAGLFGKPVVERTLTNTKDLAKHLQGRVAYVARKDVAGLPRVNEQVVQVEMSRHQHKMLEMALSGVDPAVKRTILSRVLPTSEKAVMNVLASIQRSRAISNSVAQGDPTISLVQAAERTPKLARVISDAVQHLEKTPDGRVVMFTNLVHGGLDELAAGLEFHKIPYAVFTAAGNKTWGDRDENVKKFLSGKAKVIVLTPAGTEGLNLNTATMFQMLDEHYNPERNEQAIARAVRLDSQPDRPPEARQVDVMRYQSVVPKTFFDRLLRRQSRGSVDEWVHALAERKQRLNSELRAVAEGTYKEKRPAREGILSRLFGS